MATLTLIRHGRAEGGWDTHRDPGLHEQGHAQARAMADLIAPLGPQPLWSSPLRRCRETAAPLADAWGAAPLINPGVAEIPSPTPDLEARTAWLRELFTGRWRDGGEDIMKWRRAVIETLLAAPVDTVIITHFVPINVAVGEALGKDDVVVFRPDYCSVTVLENDGGQLRLIEKGQEAETVIR
jgi:broad specificity phosphatase PhoE